MRKILSILVLIIISLSKISGEDIRTIHVFVALCDNENQGIVPVPAFMGNGKDTKNNLYWGLAGGIKTFFNKSNDWNLVKTIKSPNEKILEKVIFKHNTSNVYLLAEAYDGSKIGTMLLDFINSSSGNMEQKILVDSVALNFAGKSNLIAFIGHNAYMDGIKITGSIVPQNDKKRDTIVLACKSKKYFYNDLLLADVNPILWTTGLMAPEAYTLKWALDGWILNESNQQIKERAAQAYNKYQKCGIKNARNLFISGW